MEKQFQDQLDRIETILKTQKEKPLTFQEACSYTGLSKSYLYKLTCKREIPHFKPNGKMLYFTRQDLDNWLLRNRVESNEAIDQKALNIDI
jgi:excisionase family DNA binding protein